MATILDRALKIYENRDIVIRMKARFFFILSLIFPVILLITMSYTAYINMQNSLFGYQIQYKLILPQFICFITFLIVLLLIIRGYFTASAHTILVLLFLTTWIVIVFDRSFIVSRLDTITYVFAILALTSLAVVRKGTAIIVYGLFNLAALAAFVFFLGDELNIPHGSLLDYLADNAFAMISMTIIAFSIFAINRKALNLANNEITERARVEEALRESEERYRTLFEYSRDGITIVEPPSWKFVAANPTFINMLRLEENPGDFRDLAPWDLSPEIQPDGEPSAEKARRMIDQAMTEGWCFFEWQHRRLNGQVFPATVLLSRCQLMNRTFLQATVRDITERKKAEEQTSTSLKEKEVLLKEIHHRVKNNFQIIISLINLQSNTIKDPDLLKMFNDSANRIRAMALVHEKLYRSEDISKIDFTSYMKTITGELHSSYTTGLKNPRLHIETDEIQLGIDHAIPCGLIVNELITNALKYAFPGDSDDNLISVSLRRSGTNDITLAVSDNGIGIPESINVEETSSLGLQLVTILINQIHGTFTINRTGGTSWTITFPISDAL